MTDTTRGADPIKAFEDAIREAGMNPPKEIVPDGEIHRFAPNGNPKDDAGWYVLHADGGISAGAFGDWRQDTHHKWSAKGRQEMTQAEREDYRERVAEQRRQREEERRQRQARARERARDIWDRATQAGSDHPYLQKKGVPALKGLRQDGDRLVVKVHDGKTLHGLQFIDPLGEKKFLQDTAKDGCYCGFGKPVDVIILAEGYATAASIRQATEQPVAVAFDSGNLPKVAQTLHEKLPNALILVAGDNDEHGKGQAKSQEAAEAVGGVPVVPPREGDDWNDVHQRDGVDIVRQAFEAPIRGDIPPAGDAPLPEPDDDPPPPSDQGKRAIYIAGGGLPRMVDEAEKALEEAGLPLYQRGATLVRVLRSRGGDSRGISREAGAPMISQVTAAWMREQMTRCAHWMKYDARMEDWKHVDAPKDVAETYLARVGEWRVPFLRGIVQAPTPRVDGSIITQPGYDSASSLVFDPGGKTFPKVPEYPGRADAEAALDKLSELLKDFPFVSATDRAVAVSGILTAIARLSLETAPGHAMTAPAAGTGKSLLVDIASLIATGRRPAVLTDSRRISPEEAEKRLDTALLQGDPILALDNLTRPLDSDRLCQMLTQPSIRVRILGQSQQPEVPSVSAIFATGNNLSIQGDLCRRFMLCHLDAGMEKPYERTFEYSILEHVRQHRGELAVAAATIIRAYAAMGRPHPVTPLGSFEEWSRLIREPLVWLGMADPVGSIDAMREEDPTVTARRQLLNAWRDAFGDNAVTAARAVERANDYIGGEPVDPELRDAMMAAAPDRKGSSFSQLSVSQYLRKHKDVVTDGFCFTQAGTNRNKVALWKVMEVENGVLKQSALIPDTYTRNHPQSVNSSGSPAGDTGDRGGYSNATRETLSNNITHESHTGGHENIPRNPPHPPQSDEEPIYAYWDGDVGPEDD